MFKSFPSTSGSAGEKEQTGSKRRFGSMIAVPALAGSSVAGAGTGEEAGEAMGGAPGAGRRRNGRRNGKGPKVDSQPGSMEGVVMEEGEERDKKRVSRRRE